MSRKWKLSDELYVYNENMTMLSNTVEYLIIKIKSVLGYDYIINNIVTIMDKKIKEINENLKQNNMNFYSEKFTLKTSILNIFEDKINLSINELIKIINKLNNPIYKDILSSKLILLIIANNIKNYNKFINEINSFNIKNNIENILYYKYKEKNKLYDKFTIKEMLDKDTLLLNKVDINIDNYIDSMIY